VREAISQTKKGVGKCSEATQNCDGKIRGAEAGEETAKTNSRKKGESHFCGDDWVPSPLEPSFADIRKRESAVRKGRDLRPTIEKESEPRNRKAGERQR